MDLAGALKKHFGYGQFRPLQQQIISDELYLGRRMAAEARAHRGVSSGIQLLCVWSLGPGPIGPNPRRM